MINATAPLKPYHVVLEITRGINPIAGDPKYPNEALTVTVFAESDEEAKLVAAATAPFVTYDPMVVRRVIGIAVRGTITSLDYTEIYSPS